MKLSVIIVNYNVKYFLEQCLHSVQKAILGWAAEVIVIDNHSTDGSIAYLQPLFPTVLFITNKENQGFAKANNQALAHAGGEYVLFLNPDTLVPENCFTGCLEFMRQNPKAGALGVRMIDGGGRFLPESKRAFPSLLSSFYKLIGLASLFPQSGIFNKYALGNLSNYQNQEVGVLSGAFFLAKKKIVDDLHGFDEDFFMYGEDIDLSYRIQKAGYQNHYFAGTEIIHFKGESSRKQGLKYVKMFYAAMMVFVQKHYTTGSAKLFSYFIQFAITGRAGLTALNRLLKPFTLSIIDFIIVWASFKLLSLFWIYLVRNGKDFGFDFIYSAFTFFSALFILFAAIAGLYDKRYKSIKTLLSVVFSMAGILAVYALLPETLRFSRGVILWGGLTGGTLIILIRQLLAGKQSNLFEYESARTGKTLVVATEKEFAEIIKLLEEALPEEQNYCRIAIDKIDTQAFCNLEDLGWLEKTVPVSKIIFCAGTLSLTTIIKLIQIGYKKNTRLFFHISGTQSIIGSGVNYASDNTIKQVIKYRIQQKYQQKIKRIIDIGLSVLFLITVPIHWVFQKSISIFLNNAYAVLVGYKTWVGYASTTVKLPALKTGVITHLGNIPVLAEDFLAKADIAYARNYEWWQDIGVVFNNYSFLGKIESKKDNRGQ